jgi:hypothetical protein
VSGSGKASSLTTPSAPVTHSAPSFAARLADGDEFEEMTSMFADIYPDVAVPKSAWQWVDSA